MIKILQVEALADFQLRLIFSDGSQGLFDGQALLQRSGPLLDPLRDPAYFRRAFIDAGALCWPNGLELSPGRVHEQCRLESLNA
ncbi:DUF2442 domain-containing protein [Thauera phenolivorans]|uniref:DUF2442 domain-containing protein n=1 Tax=Thauera phenolivorans TaxID=1792543 RepID=UPI00083A611F|nr:DUF2442 domain-containing protein [Thauera phenolivorans]